MSQLARLFARATAQSLSLTKARLFPLAVPLLLFAVAPAANAQFVVPTSYTATTGEGTVQGGSFNYFDESGSQLTDTVIGANAWSANLGNGNAHEWVGWRVAEPTITFNFAQSVSISQVQLGFSRTSAAGIGLPSSATINAVPYAISSNAIGNDSRGFVPLNVVFSGTSLQISLADSNVSTWIFVDEVRFVGSPVVVPESGTLCFLGFAFVPVGVGLVRRVRSFVTR